MMLQRSRLSPPCTLPISSALALRKDDYIAALEQASVVAQPHDPARSLAIRPWIALAAGSVSDAVSYARHLIKQVAAIKQGWLKMVTAEGRPSKPGMRLIDQLPAHPVLNAEKAAELLRASWRTGARALEQLEQAGVLVQCSAGRRNRVYEAEAITAAFSAATDLSPVHFEQGPPYGKS